MVSVNIGSCRMKASDMDELGNVSWIEVKCPISPKMRREIGYPKDKKWIVFKIKPTSSIEIQEKEV